jgi:DNA-binding transcriptional LysR family regulator
MVVAVPKGHPWSRRKAIDVKDLRSEKFISREHGSGTLDSIRQLLGVSRESADELLNITMELGSTEAVKEALMAGFGFSILSRISIRHELKDGSIVEVRIRGLKLERGFYEVVHTRRPLHPIAQVFRQFIKKR